MFGFCPVVCTLPDQQILEAGCTWPGMDFCFITNDSGKVYKLKCLCGNLASLGRVAHTLGGY